MRAVRRPPGLLEVYRRLRRRYGHAGWWPGESSFEVCVGAILTQNTAWANVEKALGALRRRRLLSFSALRRLPASELRPLLRAAGTFNVKARRVSAFLKFLDEQYAGRVGAMSREEPRVLRRKLLSVHGIGPETADSIALYAAGLPLFVVDAYTRRILGRLGLVSGTESYEEVQSLFMSRLPADAALFNDYHAQLVRLGKEACRKRPLCDRCPLDRVCAKRGVPV
jgi:endonuclease-3 related protein